MLSRPPHHQPSQQLLCMIHSHTQHPVTESMQQQQQRSHLIQFTLIFFLCSSHQLLLINIAVIQLCNWAACESFHVNSFGLIWTPHHIYTHLKLRQKNATVHDRRRMESRSEEKFFFYQRNEQGKNTFWRRECFTAFPDRIIELLTTWACCDSRARPIWWFTLHWSGLFFRI